MQNCFLTVGFLIFNCMTYLKISFAGRAKGLHILLKCKYILMSKNFYIFEIVIVTQNGLNPDYLNIFFIYVSKLKYYRYNNYCNKQGLETLYRNMVCINYDLLLHNSLHQTQLILHTIPTAHLSIPCIRKDTSLRRYYNLSFCQTT